MKLEFDKWKLLGIAGTLMGVAGTLLSGLDQKNTMKKTIEKEVEKALKDKK